MSPGDLISPIAPFLLSAALSLALQFPSLRVYLSLSRRRARPSVLFSELARDALTINSFSLPPPPLSRAVADLFV